MIRETMVNTPNLASSAMNNPDKKERQMEENSILIPDFYIHYRLDEHKWIKGAMHTYNEAISSGLDPWSLKKEQAYFGG